MQLSPHFTLEEFTRSSTATSLRIKNDPPEEGIALAKFLCLNVLEPVRAKFGPLNISSGYRCHALNTAVGGAATSDHVWDENGAAADFQCNVNGLPLKRVYDWIRLESLLPFDQCILEFEKGDPTKYKCIHISYRANPRRMAMRGGTHNSTKYERDTVKDRDDI